MSGDAKLVSPVTSLLGGVVPSGMVCGVDGICVPAEAADQGTATVAEGSSTVDDGTSAVDDGSSTGEQN